MHPRIASLIIATTLATSFVAAPAEARHVATQRISRPPFVDVAAIPPYPLVTEKAPRAKRHRAARARADRLASLTPPTAADVATALPRTIAGYRDRPAEHPARRGLVTVQTAAGIPITCSPGFAADAVALIADAVASGIHFRRIVCYSRAPTHVANSNHRAGNAFDSHPHIPAAMVRAHGLRSGCDFGDCMHVDNAINVGGMAFWNRVRHPGGIARSKHRMKVARR